MGNEDISSRLAHLEATLGAQSKAVDAIDKRLHSVAESHAHMKSILGDPAKLKSDVDDASRRSCEALTAINTPFYKRSTFWTPTAASSLILILWFLSPFMNGLEFQEWVHKNVFHTNQAVSEMFKNDRYADTDGREVDRGLFYEVKNYVSHEFSRRRQAIVASARGSFEYKVTPSTATWSSADFSIPVFFNAEDNDKVAIYVYISKWGDSLEIKTGTNNKIVGFNKLFELRGAPKRDGSPVTVHMNEFTREVDDFHGVDLSPDDMHPSEGSEFRRFDLALTDDGQRAISQFAELESRGNNNYGDIKYDAQILVQLRPSGRK